MFYEFHCIHASGRSQRFALGGVGGHKAYRLAIDDDELLSDLYVDTHRVEILHSRGINVATYA